MSAFARSLQRADNTVDLKNANDALRPSRGKNRDMYIPKLGRIDKVAGAMHDLSLIHI